MARVVSSAQAVGRQTNAKALFTTAFAVFVLAFTWALVNGLLLQWLVLPALPNLHAGNGLLRGGDWVWFHTDAASLTAHMQLAGWSAWDLRPQGNAPIGIAAAFYYVTGVSQPWVVMPLNAALFGLAAACLFEIFKSLASAKLAFFAVLPFALFPSAMQIYGQIHKDVFSITGVFLIVLTWVRFAQLPTINLQTLLSRVGLVAIGCLLVWVVRPYLGASILVATVVATMVLVVVAFQRRSAGWWCGLILCLTVQVAVLNLPLNALASSAAPLQTEIQVRQHDSYLAKALSKLNEARSGFASSSPNAGSNLDTTVEFNDFGDVLGYLPRAIQVGLLAPFPATWFEEGVSPGGSAMRLIAGLEMLVSYVLLFGLVVFFRDTKAWQPEFVVVVAIAMMLILILAMVVVNVGTLYRMRYGSLQILTGLGVLGWGLAWTKRKGAK